MEVIVQSRSWVFSGIFFGVLCHRFNESTSAGLHDRGTVKLLCVASLMLNHSTLDRKAEDNRREELTGREEKKGVKLKRKEAKEIEGFMRKCG